MSGNAVQTKMTMYQAINSALDCVMSENPDAVVLGEDVEFGGVFRCTMNLKSKFGTDSYAWFFSQNSGKERVFNTPLTEQGILGFAIGLAASKTKVIAEIQFADYIFPAFDQIINELCKYRYRSGGQFSLESLIIRAPCGAVGHGGLYHSQSVEAFFTHCSGIKIVCPSNPVEAKGLLIAAARQNDPVIFLEPKSLYRASSALVSVGSYDFPIGKAEILHGGEDVTLIGWGAQTLLNSKVANIVHKEGISVEVIDLKTLLPWDQSTIINSCKKTGRVIIAHEAPKTSGFGAELAAWVQEKCFSHLKAPVLRCTGWDTPFPLVFERFYLPGEERLKNHIRYVKSY